MRFDLTRPPQTDSAASKAVSGSNHGVPPWMLALGCWGFRSGRRFTRVSAAAPASLLASAVADAGALAAATSGVHSSTLFMANWPLPAFTASANCARINSTLRIPSSLPGIGKSMSLGSLSVSINATVGSPNALLHEPHSALCRDRR